MAVKPQGKRYQAALMVIINVGVLMITGCAISRSAAPVKIALFAPFEGRYREIGYEMLYAARLAITEAGADASQIELLPIDDGGSLTNASDHAAATALNADVQVVITAGFTATPPDVLATFGDLPVLIIGSWQITDEAARENTFILSSREVRSAPLESDTEFIAFTLQSSQVTGGELLSLDQFRALREDLSDITILSSAVLPSSDFVERYRASDAFAPEPRLLSTLTYDATRIAVQATTTGQNAADQLHAIKYDGMNGPIRFETDGYWQDAPLHRYQYDADDRLIEITAATP
jgi:hypothetical protein